MRRPPAGALRAAAKLALAESGAQAALPPPLLLRQPWSTAQVGYTPSYDWLLSYTPYVKQALAGCAAAPLPGCAPVASLFSNRGTLAGRQHALLRSWPCSALGVRASSPGVGPGHSGAQGRSPGGHVRAVGLRGAAGAAAVSQEVLLGDASACARQELQRPPGNWRCWWRGWRA